MIYKNIFKLLLALILSISTAFADTEVISGFENKNIPVLNDALRDLNNNVNGNASSIAAIRAYFLNGILSLSHGGTGVALSDPGADRILFWDDSAGQVTWLTAGSGLAISGTTIATTISDYAAGDSLILGPTAFVSAPPGGAYVKICEVRLPRGGTLRVKFWGTNPSGGETAARIYRNGSAVGTERFITTATEYSEDISGWTAGDLLQLYAYNHFDSGGSNDGRIGGLRLFESLPSSTYVETLSSSGDGTRMLGIGRGGNGSSSIWLGRGAPGGQDANTVGNIGDIWIDYVNTAGSSGVYRKSNTTTWTAM